MTIQIALARHCRYASGRDRTGDSAAARDLRICGAGHVNAAFTFTTAGGNRFNTEERGAWYCAWDAMVPVSEVAWHRTRELGFAGSFHDSARHVELLADFIGISDDLTDEQDHPALHPIRSLDILRGKVLPDICAERDPAV